MCILLYFPAPDDPRPEPPAPARTMPRPVEPVVTDARAVRILPATADCPNAPCSLPIALRDIA